MRWAWFLRDRIKKKTDLSTVFRGIILKTLEIPPFFDAFASRFKSGAVLGTNS
jgi:hypothetical protein